MLKKFSVILLSLLVLSVSIFAYGPWNNSNQSNSASQNFSTPLFQNLPEGAKVSDVTFSGVVKEINLVPGQGSEILIDADDEVYKVHSGPIWLFKDYLETGKTIEVSGKLVTLQDEIFIVLEKAVINGNEFVARKNGFPTFAKKGNNKRGNITQRNNVGRPNQNGRSKRGNQRHDGYENRPCRHR
ncbi:hypothetical protein HNP65_001534 [Thermosipho japonicus]|uniref:DNA-binding protein n=1 Tax=Thermosipho japonicus TaxID=90323 RepID=A0A841GVJ9_9BACT|nr:hypothetical protein [Thermosipho japonicus]MBB6063071.1 hypothetical protein [Thermosipho japonicus]